MSDELPFGTFRINGRKVTLEEFKKDSVGIDAEHIGGAPPSGPATKGWPLRSDACGCHPSQVAQFESDATRKGVPTEFDKKTGEAIFRDKSHRRNYLKAFGYHDRNGYSRG
jgi:hypothetical protein